MNTMTADPLALANETEPDIAAMREEYSRAWTDDVMTTARIRAAEAVRYNWWSGQHEDGRMHQELLPEGKRAPYNLFPDTRVMLADSVCNFQCDVRYSAFWNARMNTQPTSGKLLNAAQAGELRALLSTLIHGHLQGWLVNNVEFVSQVMDLIGWVCVHTGWRTEKRLRYQTLTVEEIFALVQQTGPNSPAAMFLTLLADETLTDQAIAMLREFFPDLKPKRARQVVNDLRHLGTAQFPVPFVAANGPELRVLVPGQDFILPKEGVLDPENSRWFALRQYFTEETLRVRAAEEEWDEDFVNSALATKGESLDLADTSPQHEADDNAQLIEIIYFYKKSPDEDGVMGQWCTVFSPHMDSKPGTRNSKQSYAKHWLLDLAHGEYPFKFFTTEVIGRKPSDARGVPEIVRTQQREMKTHRDGQTAYAELSILPPMFKRGEQASKLPPQFGSGAVINGRPGDWETLDVTKSAKPEASFKLLEEVRQETKEYFGMPTPTSDPSQWQVHQARLVRRWLATWAQVFRQLAALAYQRFSREELTELLGRPPLLSAEDICRHSIILWFDVRTLDPEWLNDLIKNMSQFVLPFDRNGTVDMSKWVNLMMHYFSPTLAEEVSVDQQGASQALFKEVRDEVVAIFQGNQALYRGLEPTAKTKLNFLQEILSMNPGYQMALSKQGPNGQPNPHFAPMIAENLQKYVKNLQQSVVQLQVNPQTGILGVEPAGAEQQQQMPMGLANQQG